jgi:DNA repair protein RadB
MNNTPPISSGIPILDAALNDGIKYGELLQIVGPGGVGKTTLALQFSLDVVRKGNRVIYVNSEGTFPILRLKQLATADFPTLSPLISVVSLKEFSDQVQLVKQLDRYLSPEVKLIVFDTIVSLYRKECGESADTILLNRKLNQQFGIIANYLESKSFAVIVINQVRGDLSGNETFQPVADRILSYWVDHSIQIDRSESKGYREFKLLKEKESEPTTFTLELHELGFKEL